MGTSGGCGRTDPHRHWSRARIQTYLAPEATAQALRCQIVDGPVDVALCLTKRGRPATDTFGASGGAYAR
ncbi:hypothetical protein GCM10009735_62530 [Actinomadura chokoriensis]